MIKNVIETTHLLTRALGTPSRLAQVLRNAVIPMVSRLAPFQHAFVQRLSELGVAYRGSPIVEGDGERYFDNSLREGDGIRSRFLFLLGNKVDAPTTVAAKEIAGLFPEVVELRLTQGEGVTLVRPDGYVAFAARNGDGMAALGSMRSLLESQTN